MAMGYIKNINRTAFLCLLLCIFFYASTSYAAASKTFSITTEQSIDLNYTKAAGNTLLLVLPSEHGLQAAEKQLLDTLPAYKVEVWVANLLESYFLENTASNLEKLPPEHIQQLIKKLHQYTNKNILILTAGRGAIPLLRALASWPQKNTPAYLRGLILMHPKLFYKTPEPGLTARLMPSVTKTNQLIYIFQPTQSPFWWNRNVYVEGLQKSGSDVFLQSFKGIRNRFYFRPDATELENQYRKLYPKIILKAVRQLVRFKQKKRNVVKNYNAKTLVTSIKKQKQLSPYKGTASPPPLKLKSLTNKTYRLEDSKGKVVLLNFWASWCPPCVHEMPSMQKLENIFKKKNIKNFEIVAVNMAEDKKTINTFLKTKVSVSFKILLDSDGTALKQWKVFAFPTTFVIDKKGTIRYALYGGVDWMRPDIVKQLRQLIDE